MPFNMVDFFRDMSHGKIDLRGSANGTFMTQHPQYGHTTTPGYEPPRRPRDERPSRTHGLERVSRGPCPRALKSS